MENCNAEESEVSFKTAFFEDLEERWLREMYSGRLGCFQEEHNNVVTTGTNHNANIGNHEEQLSHSVASDPAGTGQVNCRTMFRLYIVLQSQIHVNAGST